MTHYGHLPCSITGDRLRKFEVPLKDVELPNVDGHPVFVWEDWV